MIYQQMTMASSYYTSVWGDLHRHITYIGNKGHSTVDSLLASKIYI